MPVVGANLHQPPPQPTNLAPNDLHSPVNAATTKFPSNCLAHVQLSSYRRNTALMLFGAGKHVQ